MTPAPVLVGLLALSDVDCTLTDFAVGLLTLALAWRAARGPGTPAVRRWSATFFAAVSCASWMGGLVHGVFVAPDDPWGRHLWTATLLAVGVAGFAAWGLVGALGMAAPTHRTWLMRAAIVQLVAHGIVVCTLSDAFWVGIAAYLPPTAALLGVLSVLGRRGLAGAALGVRALLLLVAAAVLQQLGVGLDPDWLDHNALYHVVQAVALAMLGASLARLARAAPGT